MNVAVLRAIVWPFAVLGFVALIAAAFTPPVSRATSPRSAKESVLKDAVLGRAPRANLDSVARVVTERDLFRRSRRPGPVGGVAPTTGVGASPLVPKPALTLLGLVSGPEPSAVIEGFPGVPGARVVRPGDLVGGLTVRQISAVTVEVTGMDNTWVLKVREPWRQP